MRSTPYHQGEHLTRDALEDATARCPACDFTGLRESVHTLQTEPEVLLLACPICGICSASHMPTDDALEDYYGKYYGDPGADAATDGTPDSAPSTPLDHGQTVPADAPATAPIDGQPPALDATPALTFSGADRFAEHIAQQVSAHVAPRPHLRILDFGGGDGTLAIALASTLLERQFTERVTIALVDYTTPRPSPRSEITIQPYHELSQVPAPALGDPSDSSANHSTPSRFDVIIASAILEHVPEVGAIARRLFLHAAPGALLYARTPYWVPMLRFMPNLDLTFPGHVHDMGAPFWGRVIDTFELDAELVVSRPSIVETTLRQDPLRTLAAHLLKLPSHAEVRLRGPNVVRPLWGLVGGWEVFLKFR